MDDANTQGPCEIMEDSSYSAQQEQTVGTPPEQGVGEGPACVQDEQSALKEPLLRVLEEKTEEPPSGGLQEQPRCPEKQPHPEATPPGGLQEQPGCPEEQPHPEATPPGGLQEQPGCPEATPSALALRLVLDWLPEQQDVVSFGQVCRLWRSVAQDEDVWRHPRRRVLDRIGCSWSRLMRVVRFAPANVELELEKLELRKDKQYQRTVDTLLHTSVQVKVKALDVDDEDFSESLLERLAPDLEILTMGDVTPGHLKAIAGNRAPNLFKLRFSLTPSIVAHSGRKYYDRNFAGCSMPSRLRHLYVTRCNESVLQAAAACRHLISLNVHVTTDECRLDSAEVCRLRYLTIGMRVPNSSTLKALIESCSDTLQKIEIHCASRNNGHYYIYDLDDIFGSIGFEILQEIMLVRRCHSCNTSHSIDTCKKQLTSIRRRLDNSLYTEERVKVICRYGGFERGKMWTTHF